jgi:hypothetical protein
MLVEWWNGHGFPPVPEAILPATGIIVFDGEKCLCSAHLYLDNSVGVSMMEWMVSNPANSSRESLLSLGHLLECMRQTAASLGYGITLTSISQPSLMRLAQRCGFEKTDENMAHFMSLNLLNQ